MVKKEIKNYIICFNENDMKWILKKGDLSYYEQQYYRKTSLDVFDYCIMSLSCFSSNKTSKTLLLSVNSLYIIKKYIYNFQLTNK